MPHLDLTLLNEVKLWILVHYKVSSVLSMPIEIYCHQGVIDFVGHGLSATFVFQTPQIGIMDFFGNWKASPNYRQLIFNA